MAGYFVSGFGATILSIIINQTWVLGRRHPSFLLLCKIFVAYVIVLLICSSGFSVLVVSVGNKNVAFAITVVIGANLQFLANYFLRK
ncbi:hypothetical protein N9J12_05810 [Alphaproteobacteria bacterium]|nr:hypothetical protein [Alphaproteobacteria bacterium]